MQADAIVLEQPRRISLSRLELDPPQPADVVVDVERSGISAGTERLLWSGRMPPFPGLGYPLVPGYEAVGRVVERGSDATLPLGTRVFVPGAHCFGAVRGLFGAAASRLVLPESRVLPVAGLDGEQAVLLALAATARRVIAVPGAVLPELIVGHGVLGRLLARLVVAAGGTPTVWERDPSRAVGDHGYRVLAPDADPRHDYACICDVSGDADGLDALIGRLRRGGELVLAGFYPDRVGFAFPAAFMREIRLRVSAEWSRPDLEAARDAALDGTLSLDGLVTHRRPAHEAEAAYAQAFEDPACLKMVLDWSNRP
ncbi:MAG: chlorophyll synthesis pathway protein BchC [Gluconacetobacter diazotrophicus]|nr:chlorophyll synthesis pathway protein BchC [Gluconacetobacter diazotrophicus]